MSSTVVLLVQLCATAASIYGIYVLNYFLLTTPKPRLGMNKKPLDPVGGNQLKNLFALLMAKIAHFKETSKVKDVKDAELEQFHRAEDHPFFNESYYFNGFDPTSGARLISRLSHRSVAGKLSYAFLLIDVPGKGVFSFEEDDVEWKEEKSPSGGNPVMFAKTLGLSYECLEPMKLWRIRYTGEMYVGCVSPEDREKKTDHEKVWVDLDMTHRCDTDLFWYMRDDLEEVLAHNLSQEEWGVQFFKYCINRTSNHGHYEDYGILKGNVTVAKDESKLSKEKPIECSLETFRDHSWDIRRWQCIDSLLILLIGFRKPLNLLGKEYKYLDLTLVSMPGNNGGVSRYSTGYVLSEKKGDSPILCLKKGTSINDIGWKERGDELNTREPLPETFVEIILCNKENVDKEVKISIKMSGKVSSRMEYWPDRGLSEIFEDSMDFEVTNEDTGQKVAAVGTRQSGYRVGEFDPSLGGVG